MEIVNCKIQNNLSIFNIKIIFDSTVQFEINSYFNPFIKKGNISIFDLYYKNGKAKLCFKFLIKWEINP